MTDLLVMDAARIMREEERRAIRDKSYRRFGVGGEAGRFLRDLAYSGSPKTTTDTYEIPLCRLALDHADFTSMADFCTMVGPEYLSEFLAKHWGDCSVATRANRTAAVRSFFQWGVDKGICPFNPMRTIKGPRVKSRDRQAYDRTIMRKLLGAQETLRDEIALSLCCRLAFRKNELRVCRIRDFDLVRNMVVVHGKGGKERLLPLTYKDLTEAIYLHVQAGRLHRDEFLLFPRADRTRPMDHSSVHRWFKRCLERADLPASIEMHELRHFAADELWRVTGNLVLAQQLLRHTSLDTTRLYLHPTLDDLAAGMRRVESAWREGN